MAIIDPGMGFVPVTVPKQYTVFEVGGTNVKKGTVVKLSSGTIIPVAATGGGQIGVAVAHGTDGDHVAVITDPDVIYEVTADDESVGVADIGNYVLVTAESSTSDISNQKVDVSAATGTLTANHVCVIVGLPTRVHNDYTNGSFKLRVKLVQNELIPDHA